MGSGRPARRRAACNRADDHVGPTSVPGARVTPPGSSVWRSAARSTWHSRSARGAAAGAQAGTGRRAVWWLEYGRLKPGWTVERAQAQVAAISPGVFQATVSPTYTRLGEELHVVHAHARLRVRRVEPAEHVCASAVALLGATGLVLLLTCLNLANLMLRAPPPAPGGCSASGDWRVAAPRWCVRCSPRACCSPDWRDGRAAACPLDQPGARDVLERARQRNLPGPDARLAGVCVSRAVTVLTCVLFGMSPALKALAVIWRMPCSRRPIVDRRTRGARAAARAGGRAGCPLDGARVGALLFGRTLKNLGASTWASI